MMQAQFTVRALDPRRLDSETIAAWSDLEARSLEPNAYLSPHFVLPSLRFLDPTLKAVVLLVEAGPSLIGVSGERLVGVLVGHLERGKRNFPLPHLVAYKSRHSYLTGLLLDGEHASGALRSLLGFVRAQGPRWHGIEFEKMWGDGPTYGLLATTCERLGMSCVEWGGCTRAVLHPRRDRDSIHAAWASATHEQRRRIRRLQERGEVRWVLVDGHAERTSAVGTFLDLEHQGWKCERRTSLRSTSAGEDFFSAVVAGFGAQRRALFSELSVSGRVIASTSNFVSGRSGFAFKIGWLPEFRQLSPGVQVELQLLNGILHDERLEPIEFWDSGAEEGSFIERLWPTRRRLVSIAVGSTWGGALTLRVADIARGLKNRWK